MAELTHRIKLLVIAHKPSVNVYIILGERLCVCVCVCVCIHIYLILNLNIDFSECKTLLFSKTNKDCYLRDAGQIEICETWSLLFSAFLKFEKEKEKSFFANVFIHKASVFFYYSGTERLIFKYFSLEK